MESEPVEVFMRFHSIRYLKLYFLVVVAVLLAVPAGAEEVARHGKGFKEDIEGIRVVHLAGTPREIGEQHGVLLKDEIHALIDYFLEEKGNIFGVGVDKLSSGSAVLEKFIPADLIEEMKGIAEGSDMPYEKILYMNTFLDIVSAGWVGVGPGCTNFAAMADASGTGGVVHGRNLDWAAEDKLAAANTVFMIQPQQGRAFASLAWPGVAGTLTGMNDAQISMGEMTSATYAAQLEGIPIMIHLRMLLQHADTLDAAWSVLKDNPRTTGYNVLVTDAKINDAFVAEMDAAHIVKTGPEDGVIFHTNHYINKKMAKGQKKFYAFIYGSTKHDSYYRYQRLIQLMGENKGGIGVEKAQEFLRDKFSVKENKIVSKLENTICKDDTLQSVVMLPGSGELYVALRSLPAPDSGYVHLKLRVEESAAP